MKIKAPNLMSAFNFNNWLCICHHVEMKMNLKIKLHVVRNKFEIEITSLFIELRFNQSRMVVITDKYYFSEKKLRIERGILVIIETE